MKNTMTRALLEANTDCFIRYNEAIEIFRKVESAKEKTFSDIVSTQKPFGLRTYIMGENEKKYDSVVLYANKRIAYIR